MSDLLDPRLIIHPQRTTLMAALAQQWLRTGTEAIAARGRFDCALAGGSTPRELYALLGQPAHAKHLDWSKTHIFWGDERCVGPEDPDSNYRMTREALLQKVPLPASNIHRLHGESEPSVAAEVYESELRQHFGAEARFDLLLLGLGTDGHTASLFPGSPVLDEARRWVAAAADPHVAGRWRLTLTLPLLNAARRVDFLVAGADKAQPLAQVLRGGDASAALPAARIRPRAGTLHFWADAAAAWLCQAS